MSSDSELPLHAAARTEGFELDDIARRLCWWQSPAEALRDLVRFVAQVMALGTDRDVETLARALGEEMFDQVLDAPPPGLFSLRRWNYWHVRRHRLPTPAMPSKISAMSRFTPLLDEMFESVGSRSRACRLGSRRNSRQGCLRYKRDGRTST